MLKTRWLRLMVSLGFSDNMEAYINIIGAYSEKGRSYHTIAHLESVLKCLDSVDHLAQRRDEVEIALWFHDAVYKPFSSSNESDSAKWASDFLQSNGASDTSQKRVFDLVMATAHQSSTNSIDENLIVDIDLSVLGRSRADYNAFSRGVREEYRRVPSFIYRRKRKEVLASFLSRDRIYTFEQFQKKYEASARENIAKEIETL
ncbi:hypothetical protein ISG33_12355 [Glaciecola sp. MH2013]|uniref:HD domain-containing protein n=1 Tax=Glaciecola sp. MH2013 TaxID=2785524 RepID=UPI00189F55BC|nr:hypothetical protein [Glaciecola sp. MH2013]MBF7074193.1 hypothetical protein [Glaciecola sp. MH2013]